jgi:hypothetical protein
MNDLPEWDVDVGTCGDCGGMMFHADEASAYLVHQMAKGAKVDHNLIGEVALFTERKVICMSCAQVNPFDIPADQALEALLKALPPKTRADLLIQPIPPHE